MHTRISRRCHDGHPRPLPPPPRPFHAFISPFQLEIRQHHVVFSRLPRTWTHLTSQTGTASRSKRSKRSAPTLHHQIKNRNTPIIVSPSNRHRCRLLARCL